MRDYELLYIVSGGLSEAEATKVTDQVGEALLKAEGKASNEDAWGRRRLAYPIGKDDHGWYVVTRFAMDPAKLDDFQKALNLNGKILRTVLVKATEIPTPEEAEKAKAAAEQAEQEEQDTRRAKKAPAKTRVPESVRKSAAPAAATKEPEAEPADAATRQKQLDEKLGEILKDN